LRRARRPQPLPTQAYLETYGEIDIALMLSGQRCTTVCDALWQGAGDGGTASAPRPARRSCIRWGGRLGGTPPGLVELVLRKAGRGDIEGLAAMRQTLRERMQASPLLDAAGFTRELEGALLAMRRHPPRAANRDA
jgi:hypothetical protein